MTLYRVKTDGIHNLFCVTSGYGDMLALNGLAAYLNPSDNFYCLQPPGAVNSLRQLVEIYAAEVLEVQSKGPFQIMGYSIGGVVAFAVAQNLIARGFTVSQMILLDSPFRLKQPLYELMRQMSAPLRVPAINRLLPVGPRLWAAPYGDESTVMQVQLTQEYQPRPYSGPLMYLRPETPFHADAILGWQQIAPRMTVLDVPGTHYSFIRAPHAAETMAAVNRTRSL